MCNQAIFKIISKQNWKIEKTIIFKIIMYNDWQKQDLDKLIVEATFGRFWDEKIANWSDITLVQINKID